ncbi:MAG: response regulator [bacterium]|nr:response regulator [Candidatus Sumerlaeota bacterium]
MSDKKLIMAVDDESDLLLIVKTALFSEGYDVVTASNGADGLEIAKQKYPDLVILDMMMPEMDGFEVLRRLREIPRMQKTPVIMLTGVSEKARIRQAIDSGIEYYIVKPFEFSELIAKVKMLMAGV